MAISIYPVPERIIWDKPLYKLKANGEPLPLYHTPVVLKSEDPIQLLYHPRWVAYGLLSAERGERVEFCVEDFFGGEPTEAVITPKSLKENATIKNGKIYFSLTAPATVCLTVNGQKDNMLILFLNPPESELPKVDPADPAVHYFAPGEHWLDETLSLKDGETVYLAPGALVHGRINSRETDNLRILGYGILTSEGCTGRWIESFRAAAGVTDKTPRSNLVSILDCKNLEARGICLVDADGWTLQIGSSSNVVVDGVKIIGHRCNSDGIDLCSVQDAVVENCFIRTSDDCLVVKAFRDKGDCKNLLFRNCILYGDRASAIEIGHELQGNDIYNVRFENIDILNCTEETYGYHAIDITNVDTGTVHDIVYDNIRIEDCVRLLGFRIREGVFSHKDRNGYGSVHGITVRNITADVDRAMFFSGRDEEHPLYDVTLENIVICGQKLTSLQKARYNPFIKDIRLIDGEQELDRLESYPDALNLEPLDIHAMTNVTLGLCTGIYGVNGEDWMSLPDGPILMEGIPFQKAAQGYHPEGKEGSFTRAVVPANRVREIVPAAMDLDFFTSHLFFLHTGVNTLSPIDTILMRYVITYEDGTSEIIPVYNQNDCNAYNTWSLGGWQPVWKSLRFYIMPWKNPHPEKKLCRLEMLDGDLPDLGILVGVTKAK